MKSIFSQISKFSLFNHAKRLAMAVVFLSFATVASASWTANANAYARFVATDDGQTGTGKVYVGSSETPTYEELGVDAEANQDKSGIGNSTTSHNFTFYWSATVEPLTNNVFMGWYKDPNMGELHTQDATFSDIVSDPKGTETGEKTYYALFRKVIVAKDFSWTKTTETANTTFDVSLNNATNFRVVSAAHEKGETRNFTCEVDVQATTADKGVLSLYAGTDVVDGDVFNVVLATDNGGEVLVKVKIVSKITVTFELPKRGRGYYEALQTNNGNASTYNSQTAGETKSVDLTSTNQFRQTITAYPEDGYRLYRWILTDKNGNTTYPTDNPLIHNIQDGDIISVEFLPTGLAQFMVKDDPDKKLYYELDGDNGAFARAAAIGKNTVVVYSSGTLYTEYKTPNAEGKYEIHIPVGYTLLVPGDANYTVNTTLNNNDNEIGDLDNSSTKCFSYLTLLPNTRIVAEGNICVFSKLSYKQRYNGLPSAYGEIKMGASTEIAMKGGSQLTCFGYITGDPSNSQVVVDSAATVYEAFQMRDWRGGTAASGMKDNDQLVFPVGQYYVQSIETKLIVKHGAKEYVSSCVAMSMGITLKFPLNFPFIMMDNGSADDEGFLCLGLGSQVVKWYDYTTDRQMYRIEGVKSGATAKFGKMVMDVSVKVESNKYVLAITNNIDVTLDNIQVTSLFDMALLADAKLNIEDDAALTVNGEIFVYDKEQQRKEYFYPGSTIIQPVLYTAHHDKTPGVRTDAAIKDASIIVDGKLIIQESANALHGTGLYTTAMDASGTSTNPADYGANITSNGGGIVDFQVVGTQTVTYQYDQTATKYLSIPITNARLRNEDGTYAAGDTMTVVNKFLYYKPNETIQGKWLIPTFGIPNAANSSNIFNITLPQPKTQNVVCNVTTAGVENISIANFTNITLQSGSRFAYTANSATYNKIDDEHGQLTIPLTYAAQNIHNVDAPYTEEITISYTYLHPIENVTKSESANITLTAIEDYTPKFKVAVNSVDVTEIKSHTFPTTNVGASSVAPVVITPDNSTVASLASTAWSAGATAEPTFTAKLGEGANKLTAASVTYSPQVQSDADAGVLTIKATYTDAASQPIPYSIDINLSGAADKQVNTLAFKSDLATTPIYQGQSIANVFDNIGNGEPIDFTYTYQDGTDASALVKVEKEEPNYKLTAFEPTNPAITEMRTVTITATQEATESMAEANRSVIVEIYPPVIWNWSNLYFGNTYDNPVVVSNTTTPWTLTKKTDANNLVTLSGNTPNYTATIGNGNANQVYTAVFTFTQGSYTKDLTSNIFADPRVLGYCVDYTRQFRGVSTSNTTVTFDEATRTATFNENNTWEINMIGIPDKLTFNASGDNTWYIGERANESTNYSDVVVWSKLSGAQTIQLKPTTSQVIIQYGSGSGNDGTIANLCISELEISADQKVVYFPINKDGSESSRTIVLTHTQLPSPTINLDNKFTISSVCSDNLGSNEEPYYQTTVTIMGDKSKVTKGSYNLTAKQGSTTITIPVYADEFPQGLPVKLATDDIKRYHFIATKPDKVAWDEQNREVVFQAPEGSQTIRSVTFAFEGAPSRVSFNASQDVVDAEWTIYESVDGTDGSFQVSGLANRDTEAGGAFMHNLKYTTRYLRIVYNSENKGEVALSNFVIEGDPMLLVNPDELEFSDTERAKTLTLTAINLNNIRIELDNATDFQMSHGAVDPSASYTLSSTDYPDALGKNKVGDIVINTQWITNSIVNDGMITIYNKDDNDSILAKVKLVGAGKYLHMEDAKTTGLYTGVPDGTRDTDGDGNPNTEYKYTFHGADYSDTYQYHPIDLTNTFATDGTALFDYLFVYGETTTIDATTDITAPSSSDEKGSNARTPYYVYKRDMDAYGNFDRYRFVTMVDNANEGTKAHVDGVTTKDSTTYINVPKNASVRVYITGFCPYASTGADKFQEGVFFFRGMAGSKLDVYLEDAHIFARNKMMDGQPFYTRGDERNPTFTEGYARGSGGVLVFECVEKTENMMMVQPFDVTLHTTGNNLLKSNYGCFNYFFGMDPFQISAPIHVRLHSADHVRTSKTVLNFTDEWPNALNADRTVKTSTRTNGFLSLQKLNNNAPSIDLGNPLTEVNFRGGQVQLQNAQIVSTNYKTTLAISYRSGEYGGDNVGLKFAYGIGTDSVGGTVNFYDGTITVLPMKVAPAYQQYYLMDPELDAEGDTVRDANGSIVYTDMTTCLRTPKNTNVYGGSICWLRACQHVTSKGGAPNGPGGKMLGQYVYEFGGDDTKDNTTNLVTKIKFPDNVEGLSSYYNTYGTYGIQSVTPDTKNKLYFWIPEGYGGVTAEKDNVLTTWKACMTEISAGFGTLEGTVGGPTPVEKNEEIKYMLYCKIDENISNVITAGTGEGINRVYSYSAPVKVPPVAQGFVGGTYTSVTPSMVGAETQNEVLSDTSYVVTDKIYYVTNATADVWQTFTAPFDVEKIWVVETFSEAELIRRGNDSIQGKQNPNLRNAILLEQARHNADFAAFFGVSMAIGTTDSLGTIFNDFKTWGEIEDRKDTLPDGSPKTPLYNGQGQYTLRGRYPLTPYYRRVSDSIANFDEAHFYLNENKGNWTTADGYQFATQWTTLTDVEVNDGILMHKGRTYAMLFPYCTGTGCTVTDRTEWDYWSGKFLIFESTDGTKTGGHIVDGANLFDSIPFGTTPSVNQAIVSGNGTFSYLRTDDPNVYIYNPIPAYESFIPNIDLETGGLQSVEVMPTTAILWANIQAPASNMRVRDVSHSGEIRYDIDDNDNPGTATGNQGGNIPTVGGGNDLFITSTVEGINIAVAEPQHVRVLSSTGAVLYSGMVQTAVDVALPTTGVYVITGENEVHKILH